MFSRTFLINVAHGLEPLLKYVISRWGPGQDPKITIQHPCEVPRVIVPGEWGTVLDLCHSHTLCGQRARLVISLEGLAQNSGLFLRESLRAKARG